MNKRMKLANGITLIALVITIIVLLILAGISVATLFGENGLIEKTAKSKEETIIGQEKEEIALAYNAVKVEKKGGIVTAEELEVELRGKAKVIEKNNKLVITYQETGHKYYITQDGKIGKLEGENTEIDIQKGDIMFTYNIEGEEYNESKWTNKNVKVTAKINEEKITNNGEYQIQITKTPEIEESWKTETTEEFKTNGTLYARLIDTFDRKTKSMLSANVTNIDKEVPTIGSVTGSTATGNTGTVTVSTIADTGGSGLAGIYINTSSTTPSVDATGWENNTESSYTKTVTTNGTYYVWVKDDAGNISETQTCTVSGIVAKVTGVTLTNATVNKGSTVTISKTLTGSTSYKSIEFTSSNTEVATIVSDTGVATGVSAGTSTITCTVTNYDGTTVSSTCTLTVKLILANEVEIGDYVAYDATNNYSYTSPVGSGPSHGNGSASQTFTSSSDIKWRVLSKNTSTGEVVLVSEGGIGQLTLVGAIGYLYAEEELNKICSIYGHGVGANTNKSFSYLTGGPLDGLERGYITGSGARSMNLTDVDSFNVSWGITTGRGNGYNGYYPTKTTETGISSEKSGYIYWGSTYRLYQLYEITESITKSLVCGKNNSVYNYFLAKESTSMLEYQWELEFGVFMANSSQLYGHELLYNYKGYASNKTCVGGVRPVVYLKPNVEISGKDSNGAWTIIDN